ncbi:hypothetical protein WJX74_000162 [Apatococcus lobatus]|uniref:Uncharacterized protein n=1 Tax=Apatococcus lobatus TaxID=904363 RepID=A0AAW1R2G6_9CHLO
MLNLKMAVSDKAAARQYSCMSQRIRQGGSSCSTGFACSWFLDCQAVAVQPGASIFLFVLFLQPARNGFCTSQHSAGYLAEFLTSAARQEFQDPAAQEGLIAGLRLISVWTASLDSHKLTAALVPAPLQKAVAQFCSALPYLRTDHAVPSEPNCWLTQAINTIRTVYPRSEALELPLMVQVLLLQAQQHLQPLFEPQADMQAFEGLISDAARQRHAVIQTSPQSTLTALAAMPPIPSGSAASGMQSGRPSTSRRRRSESKPSSPVSLSAAGDPAASAAADTQGPPNTIMMPSAVTDAHMAASFANASTPAAQVASPAAQASRTANVNELTGPMEFAFSMPSTLEPDTSVYLPGVLISPASLAMAPELALEGALRDATPLVGSVRGIIDDPQARSSSTSGGAATPLEPSTVSSVSQLDPFGAPNQPHPALPADLSAATVSSRPSLIIQGLQLQATRQLSMSPCTTSAAFPDIFPNMYDTQRCFDTLSPGVASTAPTGLPFRIPSHQNSLSPSPMFAALPAGLPSSRGATCASSSPFTTGPQHRYHHHHHHEQLPPDLEDATPGGSALSQIQDRHAELRAHGIPITSPQAMHRQPEAGALTCTQDRRAEQELHGIAAGSLPAMHMLSGQQRLIASTTRETPEAGRHLYAEQQRGLRSPAVLQPSFLRAGPFASQQLAEDVSSTFKQVGPQSLLQPSFLSTGRRHRQQSSEGRTQMDAPAMLQPSPHESSDQRAMQQLHTGLSQQGRGAMEPDPFWRAIPRLVEAADFSENAPALSQRSMRSLLGNPQAMGLQPSNHARLGGATSTELQLPGQPLGVPQPLEGRLIGFQNSPRFLQAVGPGYGTTDRFGQRVSPLYTLQQPALQQRGNPVQAGLPSEFNLLHPDQQVLSIQHPSPPETLLPLTPQQSDLPESFSHVTPTEPLRRTSPSASRTEASFLQGAGNDVQRPDGRAPQPSRPLLEPFDNLVDWLPAFPQPTSSQRMQSALLRAPPAEDPAPPLSGAGLGSDPQVQMESLGREPQHVQQRGDFRDAAPALPPCQQSAYMQAGQARDLQPGGFFQGYPVSPGHEGALPGRNPLGLPHYGSHGSHMVQPLPDVPQRRHSGAQEEALEPLARPPHIRRSQGPTITDGSPNIALDEPSQTDPAQESSAGRYMGVSSEATERARRHFLTASRHSSGFDRSQVHARPPAGRSLSATGRSSSAGGRSNASLMVLADRLVAFGSPGPCPSSSSSAVLTSSPAAGQMSGPNAPSAGPRGQKRGSPDSEGAGQQQSMTVAQPMLADEAEEMQSLWAALSQPESQPGSPQPPSDLPAWHFDPDIIPPFEAPESPPEAEPSQSLHLPGPPSPLQRSGLSNELPSMMSLEELHQQLGIPPPSPSPQPKRQRSA